MLSNAHWYGYFWSVILVKFWFYFLLWAEGMESLDWWCTVESVECVPYSGYGICHRVRAWYMTCCTRWYLTVRVKNRSHSPFRVSSWFPKARPKSINVVYEKKNGSYRARLQGGNVTEAVVHSIVLIIQIRVMRFLPESSTASACYCWQPCDISIHPVASRLESGDVLSCSTAILGNLPDVIRYHI